MSGGSIDPTEAQIAAFASGTDQEMRAPIAMINLLRFRERAEYPDGFEAEPCSGREAYGRYAEGAIAAVGKVGGSPLWGAEAHGVVIGPSGEEWDQALIVHYPSREAFLRMIGDPEYQAIVPHRRAALADSRLIVCDQSGPIAAPAAAG